MMSNDITIIKNDAIEFVKLIQKMDESQKHDILMLLTGYHLGIEASDKSA